MAVGASKKTARKAAGGHLGLSAGKSRAGSQGAAGWLWSAAKAVNWAGGWDVASQGWIGLALDKSGSNFTLAFNALQWQPWGPQIQVDGQWTDWQPAAPVVLWAPSKGQWHVWTGARWIDWNKLPSPDTTVGRTH